MAEDTQIVNEQYISSLLEEKINDDALQKEHRDRQKKTNQVFAYSGASKRKFVVEVTNWGASLEERRGPNYELGAQQGPRRDRLREVGGKYWGYDIEASTAKLQSVTFISKGSAANTAARVPFSMWVSEPKYYPSPENDFVGKRNPFFEVQQVVRLRPDKKSFFSNKNVYRADNWRALIEGFQGADATGNSGVIDELVEYNYLSFDMQLPFNYRQLDDLNITGPQYAKIRPEYNFYIKDYEEMLRFGDGVNQPETVFPNLYALMMEKMNEISNRTFANHINLGGSLTDGDATIGTAKKDKFTIKKHAGQYFDLYGRQFSKALDTDTLQGGASPAVGVTGDKFKNIVVPLENIDLLKEMSDKKELFPMFVDMEFSTDKMTEFAQMLSDTMMTNDFMWSMVKDIVSASGFTSIEFMETVEVSTTLMQEDGTSTVEKNISTTSAQRRVWNVFDWLSKNSLVDFDTGVVKTPSFSSAAADLALRNAVFLDDGSVEENLMVDPKMKFFKSLLGVIFIGKLKTFLKNRFRTYDEIIEGHPSHTETVLYRVEKTLADESGSPIGDTIQNFWFPNTNQIDVLRLVDTQVKYGKRYSYTVYAYQLVVNTKYSYHRSHVWDEGAAFVVRLVPEVLLIEQPIFVDDQLIMDDPPVPPEVEIVPYFANGRKLLFNLKSAVGEYHLDPIVIDAEDKIQHDKIRVAQKIRGDEPIRFKGDDSTGLSGGFTLYRVEEHPKSWYDFSGRSVAVVRNPGASTGEFVDVVRSNQKYYYTCRMTDAHGHVSNPTPIYEVELVNDEGSVYMTKRIVDFAPREPKNPSRKMKRLLQIKPAINQTLLNGGDDDESAFTVKNVSLGDQQESPWGRRFKFRIVSRKTGKKLDVNVDFKIALDRRETLK